jgi:hypothetical protein
MLIMHDGKYIVKKKIKMILQVLLHVNCFELMTNYLEDHSNQIHNLVVIAFSSYHLSLHLSTLFANINSIVKQNHIGVA